MKIGPYKSQDQVINLIIHIIHDAYASHGINTKAAKNTSNVVRRRFHSEGPGFLTKTLPRLGKCLDCALSTDTLMTKVLHGFSTMKGSELPMLFGELFASIFDKSGSVLHSPDATCVRTLRDLCYLFYKYELPYRSDQEQAVIDQFVRTEESLETSDRAIDYIERRLDLTYAMNIRALDKRVIDPLTDCHIVLRKARISLSTLFSSFDPVDIVPKHGPGAVSTKEQFREKYLWSNVSAKLTSIWPLDSHFCASGGHACDSYREFSSLGSETLSARVILVPKDSRGPRLISCEPVDFQWIQGGLQRSLYNLVESHPLTRENVRFTNQEPNRNAALAGSWKGRYATLDLKEASDRVSVRLVTALFPEHVTTALLAARTDRTQLPDGSYLTLRKFAPMGSAICFPIMALTIWSILDAGAPDADTRERIYVYGDDVIVPSHYVASAITLLESFGLLVNRSKSCTSGFFRESCGMDAYHGVNVTPVRIRKQWSESPHPNAYEAWISYANSFFERKWYLAYNYVVEELEAIYGSIPTRDMNLSCPSLDGPTNLTWFRSRTNLHLQKREFRVRVTKSVKVRYIDTGWPDLLRIFSECGSCSPLLPTQISPLDLSSGRDSVSVYTRRRENLFSWAWR
jgi:hypothetical protein